MKPLHLAVAAAVLVVAALVAVLVSSGQERGGGRRAGERGNETPRGADAGKEGEGHAPAQDANAGAGSLSITLAIVDPDDAPVAQAEVEIDDGAGILRATADAQGKLSVRGLARGLYDLRARRGNLAGALHFELRRTTDLGTLRLTTAITVRGHVFGAQGQPLKGARVEACRASDRAGDLMATIRGMLEPEEIVARTASREDGAWELVLPAGGTYGLRASAKGFAQEGESARLYKGDADGIDFWLLPGALLEGHVLDTRQSPIPGARVLVIDPMALFGRRVPKSEATTGADGAFSMVVQPSQQSMLVARAAGYASSMQPNLRLPQTNLVITLDEGVALKLKAVDEERPEIPAPHVHVIALYKGGFATGETDDSGLLLIENLPTRGAGMGNEQELFLFGGGFVPETVDLGRKEPVEGVVDLGVVELAPGGTVRGKVLDKATGEGVAGAQVRAFGGLDPQLQIFATIPVLTAKDGSFKLTGVPLGATMVTASHPDYASDVDPMTIFMGMGGGSGGTALFPEGVREIEKNVELTPAASISGVVLGPGGEFVAGATVAEVADDRMMMRQMLGESAPTTTSDANGAFVLKGLRPGTEVTVSATHRDYGPSEEERGRPGSGETLRLLLAKPLTIQGVVVDEKGAAVQGVRVHATRASAASSPRAPLLPFTARPSITDEEGKFLLRNVPTGELTLSLDHPDFVAQTQSLTLKGAHDVGRIVLSRGGTITGEVVDGEGKPVPGIGIYASPRSGDDGYRQPKNAASDEKGRFSMSGLADGEYTLRMWDRNYYAEERVVRAGDTNVRFVVRAAAKLFGRVLGRGAPVSGASIRAQRGDDYLGWGRSGADGTFEIAPLPPDEPFELTIDHDAFRELKVEGVRPSDRTQDFVMQTGAEVSGRVVDAQGRGVNEAQVQVRVGGNVRSVTTNETGAFTAGGLDEGQASVRLDESSQGFIPTEWIDVPTGSRDVRLVATLGESISGVVRDREGKPVRQLSVQALDAQGNVASSTWVWQQEGAFELRGLRPGVYTVLVQRYDAERDEPPPPHSVAGVATGTKNLDIRLER